MFELINKTILSRRNARIVNPALRKIKENKHLFDHSFVIRDFLLLHIDFTQADPDQKDKHVDSYNLVIDSFVLCVDLLDEFKLGCV
jgi:hypothetical protein